jgi:hypothetical protein
MSDVMVSVYDRLSHDELTECRALCALLSQRLGRPVTLAYVDRDTLDDLRMWAVAKTNGAGVVDICETNTAAEPLKLQASA